MKMDMESYTTRHQAFRGVGKDLLECLGFSWSESVKSPWLLDTTMSLPAHPGP